MSRIWASLKTEFHRPGMTTRSQTSIYVNFASGTDIATRNTCKRVLERYLKDKKFTTLFIPLGCVTPHGTV